MRQINISLVFFLSVFFLNTSLASCQDSIIIKLKESKKLAFMEGLNSLKHRKDALNNQSIETILIEMEISNLLEIARDTLNTPQIGSIFLENKELENFLYIEKVSFKELTIREIVILNKNSPIKFKKINQEPFWRNEFFEGEYDYFLSLLNAENLCTQSNILMSGYYVISEYTNGNFRCRYVLCLHDKLLQLFR